MVLTPYRAQVEAVGAAVAAAAAAAGVNRNGVTVSTIDCYQGRDAEAVVLSFVVGGGGGGGSGGGGGGGGGRGGRGGVGPLLREWRRVNVGLSRARAKLVLVGSPATLAGNGYLRRLLGAVRGRGWMHAVVPGKDDAAVAAAADDGGGGGGCVGGRPAVASTPPPASLALLPTPARRGAAGGRAVVVAGTPPLRRLGRCVLAEEGLVAEG